MLRVIPVKKLYPDAKLPRRASPGAVAYDICAYHVVDKETRDVIQQLPASIPGGGSMLFGTGITFAVAFPYDCEVRPRSGLASKFDVELSNSPGTIDPDYRGEAGILLRNRGKKPYLVNKGDRIAQILFKKVELPVFMEVDSLPPTSRGSGGFGSTGVGEILLGDAEYKQLQHKLDRHFMNFAVSASSLSDCLRGAERDAGGHYIKNADGSYRGATRKFGCVIVKGENVISHGYNCRTGECGEEMGCVRERENIASGVMPEKGCDHAEKRALKNYARVGGPSLEDATMYVNAEPCIGCAKDIVGTGIGTMVVPVGVYENNGLAYLQEHGVEIRYVDLRKSP